MADRKIRCFEIDGDVLEIEYVYDHETGRWFGNYPVFVETPRYTPGGRPWKNVFESECSFSDSEFGDCGGCSHFRREDPLDVIAVCYCEELREVPHGSKP